LISGDDKMSDPVRCKRGLNKQLPKRFYTSRGVIEGDAEGGFVVALDGKPVRTPSRQPLGVPHRDLAEALAAEWEAQGDKHIDPAPCRSPAWSTPPSTEYRRAEAVFEEILRYGGSDLLCYRADGPETLMARESRTSGIPISTGRRCRARGWCWSKASCMSNSPPNRSVRSRP
jgi:chaperone required for assembly of F1-ATPase